MNYSIARQKPLIVCFWEMIKTTINWLVFLSSLCYSAWTCFTMLGAFFVVGNNDTALEVLGILAIGFFVPPASLLAIRHRRLAAAIFILASVLWTLGVLDSDSYIATKFGTNVAPGDQVRSLSRVVGFPFFLAIFYLSTDLLKWPLISPRDTVQNKLEVRG
jgi:hypothetical protein